MDDREQRIRERAHEIWEQEGRLPGREREHWARAEEEVAGRIDPGEGSAAALQGEGMLASPGSAAELPTHDAKPKRSAGARKRTAGNGESSRAKKPAGPSKTPR